MQNVHTLRHCFGMSPLDQKYFDDDLKKHSRFNEFCKTTVVIFVMFHALSSCKAQKLQHASYLCSLDFWILFIKIL